MKKENENAIIQNLKDTGCDSGTITAFVEDYREDKIDEGLQLLAMHRHSLLEGLHKKQKQIDCLDYLVYQIENAGKEKHKEMNQLQTSHLFFVNIAASIPTGYGYYMFLLFDS